MTIGIYKLNFNSTDKVYIGQSTNIELRYITHRTTLKNNKGTKKLQEAYNTYGMPKLDIVLECSVDELDAAENDAISIFNSIADGFNTMSESGYRSELKGDLAGNSKYSNDLIEEAFHYLIDNKLTHAEITEITGISRGALSDVSSGISHKWLRDKYPKEYQSMLDIKGTTRKVSKNTASSRKIQYPQVISPEGVIHTVSSLRGFCREHGLNHGNFGELLRGFRDQCKGWKIFR